MGFRRYGSRFANAATGATVVGAVLFPYCLALGYWNGERRSRPLDLALFTLAVVLPYLIMILIRSWLALAVVYAGATAVTLWRIGFRRRNALRP